MYLNLDLLYNTYKYLYPLFYYGDNYGKREVYSPMTFKSVLVNFSDNYFSLTLYDYKSAFSRKNNVIEEFFAYNCTFTENVFYFDKEVYMEKCKPFLELDPENLYFLKSNTRIKLK